MLLLTVKFNNHFINYYGQETTHDYLVVVQISLMEQQQRMKGEWNPLLHSFMRSNRGIYYGFFPYYDIHIPMYEECNFFRYLYRANLNKQRPMSQSRPALALHPLWRSLCVVVPHRKQINVLLSSAVHRDLLRRHVCILFRGCLRI